MNGFHDLSLSSLSVKAILLTTSTQDPVLTMLCLTVGNPKHTEYEKTLVSKLISQICKWARFAYSHCRKLLFINKFCLPLWRRNYPPVLYRIVVLEMLKKFLEIHQWYNSFLNTRNTSQTLDTTTDFFLWVFVKFTKQMISWTTSDDCV